MVGIISSSSIEASAFRPHTSDTSTFASAQVRKSSPPPQTRHGERLSFPRVNSCYGTARNRDIPLSDPRQGDGCIRGGREMPAGCDILARCERNRPNRSRNVKLHLQKTGGMEEWRWIGS